MARRPGKSNINSQQLQQAEVQNLIMMLRSGKHKELERVAKKLIKRHPNAPVLRDLLSNAQLAQSDFQGAAGPLETLLDMNPDYVDGVYNLGLAYMNLGRAEDAIVRFREVVEKRPQDADAFNNLGAALFELEQYEDAISAYEKAVELKPDFVPALRNIGAALRDMRRYEESEKYLSKIPFLMPRYAPGHLSLGMTYKHMGKDEKALCCFETTLKLDPDNREANYEIGNIHANSGRFTDAIDAYRKVNSPETRIKILEMMHQGGENPEELLESMKRVNAAEPRNLRAAAFSAFASQQYDVPETHPFAPDPFRFVSIRNIQEFLSGEPDFLPDLMLEAEKVTAVWENRTTRGGFQTHGNLFEQGNIFSRLEEIIRSHLKSYVKEFSDKDAGIIQHFPKTFELNGWHVKLVKSGFQKPHIHTRGWVSGVLYLKIPKEIKGDEGAIAFSLHGYGYRKEKEEIPVKQHIPKEGDLVLFPSSLFHHTIPFESDEDRQCIAFDVLPF
ncbi:MAG: tetratricopeptide repeat protein [Rhizobiaceae bacterium]